MVERTPDFSIRATAVSAANRRLRRTASRGFRAGCRRLAVDADEAGHRLAFGKGRHQQGRAMTSVAILAPA